MANRIFISYRREDSRGSAGRLYDQLAEHFGRDRIFMDVDTIQPGLDFVEAIESSVDETDAMIVVIGPTWLNAADSTGRLRLDNPEDFVRLEVSRALDRNIRVIPVLIERSAMPLSTELPDNLKPLARRNALEISHTRFHSDTRRLIVALELALEQAEADRKAEAERAAAEKAEAEGRAAEKAEAERIATEEAEAERVADEKAEAERLAAKKAETERVAAEKAEADRLAAQKAETERIAAQQAEADRLAAEKAEAERLAAEKAETERIAAQKAEADRLAAEKAEADRLAAEKAEADRTVADKERVERPANALASKFNSFMGISPAGAGEASPDVLEGTGWLIFIEGIALTGIGLFLLLGVRPAFALYWFAVSILALLSISVDRAQWGWKLTAGILGVVAGVMTVMTLLSAGPFDDDSYELRLIIIAISWLVIGGSKLSLWRWGRDKNRGTVIFALVNILLGSALLAMSLSGFSGLLRLRLGDMYFVVAGAIAFAGGLSVTVPIIRGTWWLTLIEGLVLTFTALRLLVVPAGARTEVEWGGSSERYALYMTYLFSIASALVVYWIVVGTVSMVSTPDNRAQRGWKTAIGLVGILAGLTGLVRALNSSIQFPGDTTLVIILGVAGLIIGGAKIMLWRLGVGRGSVILGAVNIWLGLAMLAFALVFSPVTPNNREIMVNTGVVVATVTVIVAFIAGLAAIVSALRQRPA
jgi:hypothetical protein